jgi:hypothetical protein
MLLVPGAAPEAEACGAVGGALGHSRGSGPWGQELPTRNRAYRGHFYTASPSSRGTTDRHKLFARCKLSTGWISARVEFYIDGKNTFNEDYFDIKPNMKFDPAVFDPQKFNETSLSEYLDK